MSAEYVSRDVLRIDQAVAELQEMLRGKYPTATFEVETGDDPDGTYLWATVDVEDTDSVLDVVIDRLIELQLDERLPVHVIPIRTPDRVAASMRARASPFP